MTAYYVPDGISIELAFSALTVQEAVTFIAALTNQGIALPLPLAEDASQIRLVNFGQLTGGIATANPSGVDLPRVTFDGKQADIDRALNL